jgi:hypothetical protein
MAELVDASDSKSDSARSAGSIPARGTKSQNFINDLNALSGPALPGPVDPQTLGAGRCIRLMEAKAPIHEPAAAKQTYIQLFV